MHMEKRFSFTLYIFLKKQWKGDPVLGQQRIKKNGRQQDEGMDVKEH